MTFINIVLLAFRHQLGEVQHRNGSVLQQIRPSPSTFGATHDKAFISSSVRVKSNISAFSFILSSALVLGTIEQFLSKAYLSSTWAGVTLLLLVSLNLFDYQLLDLTPTTFLLTVSTLPLYHLVHPEQRMPELLYLLLHNIPADQSVDSMDGIQFD